MDQKLTDFREEMRKNLTETNENSENQSLEIRFGSLCPKCKIGKFDYDGMLNLVCSHCGYTSGGCFT
jgi:uncharacterized protein (DUF983 family)